MASIDVVSHEQVVGVRQLSPEPEKLPQIMELPMDISANRDGSSNWLDVRFLDKNFFSFSAKGTDFLLR